ncbi:MULTISPECIES: hypothetical protein [Nocardiaceae]|uniref:hypothetical protein n=1 Tax=Nocardiaceae TaxID=85025 RepID=UPI000A79E01B|nr:MULTISPECIES: hypothetical protein [Rhodococcus]
MDQQTIVEHGDLAVDNLTDAVPSDLPTTIRMWAGALTCLIAGSGILHALANANGGAL